MSTLPHLTPTEQAMYAALMCPAFDVSTSVGVKQVLLDECLLTGDHGPFNDAKEHLNTLRQEFIVAAMIALHRSLSEERAESARLRALLNDVLKR